MQNENKLNDAALKEALDASPSDRRLTRMQMSNYAGPSSTAHWHSG